MEIKMSYQDFCDLIGFLRILALSNIPLDDELKQELTEFMKKSESKKKEVLKNEL